MGLRRLPVVLGVLLLAGCPPDLGDDVSLGPEVRCEAPVDGFDRLTEEGEARGLDVELGLDVAQGHGCNYIPGAVSASDLDADGSAELLVGSPFGEGAVYVFEAPLSASMELTDATTTIIGAVDGGEFGASLAVFADLDGDGIGEVAIGAPTEQTVELFTGLTY